MQLTSVLVPFAFFTRLYFSSRKSFWCSCRAHKQEFFAKIFTVKFRFQILQQSFFRKITQVRFHVFVRLFFSFFGHLYFPFENVLWCFSLYRTQKEVFWQFVSVLGKSSSSDSKFFNDTFLFRKKRTQMQLSSVLVSIFPSLVMFTLSFEKVFVCTVPFAKKVFWQFSYRPWEKKKKNWKV